MSETVETVPPARDGPFLAMAAICEKVLEEKDGVLSVIRIVDRSVVRPQLVPGVVASSGMPPTVIALTVVLSLKSGNARGSHRLSLQPETPSGLKINPVSVSVLFEGEDRGVNLVMPMQMQVTQEGLYWFDVLLDDQRLTRIPLRVVYQVVQTNQPGTAQLG